MRCRRDAGVGGYFYQTGLNCKLAQQQTKGWQLKKNVISLHIWNGFSPTVNYAADHFTFTSSAIYCTLIEKQNRKTVVLLHPKKMNTIHLMRIICSTRPSGRTQQVSQWTKTTKITPDWTAICKWFLIPRFRGFGMGRNDQRLLVFKPPVARTGTFSQRHFLPHLTRCASWVKPGWTEISLVPRL